MDKCTDMLSNSNKYPQIEPVDRIDIYATFGLMYFRAVYNINNRDLNIAFSDKHGSPPFSSTMSRLRFEFISSHMCFDDPDTRKDRWQHDRFAAMREIFEECNKNFARALVPDDYLTLDETLYPMRNQIAFKQYNPDKPAKYGMLFKSINSARNAYTHSSHVYCGKRQGEPTTEYVSGTINYIKLLVNEISRFHDLSGRNISMDRLYTSFEIANWLLQKNITMIGTLQMNRVGIPPQMKEFKERECFSTEVYWEENGNTNLSSYVVKTSKGKKNVLLLSTVEPILGTTKYDEAHKPALYKLYDFSKGGTDIVDQKIGSYTVKSKSRKWTKVALAYLLDTIRVNSSTLLAMNDGKDPKSINSFNFGFELATDLVMPHIDRRSRQGLSLSVLQKISSFTGEKLNKSMEVIGNFSNSSEHRARCKECLSECQGVGHKGKKDKLTKTKSLCQKCGNPYCQNHLIYICNNCYRA